MQRHLVWLPVSARRGTSEQPTSIVFLQTPNVSSSLSFSHGLLLSQFDFSVQPQ